MVSKDRNKLAGKHAIVTGGSRGIGKAVAAAYAGEGARVLICGRNGVDVERAVDEIRRSGGDIHGLAGDVGLPEDVRRVVLAAMARFGSIEVLVNNASLLGPRVAIVDYPFSSWVDVMRINLNGIFLMTQEVLKVMVPRRQGSIINVSSGVGRVGKANWGAYVPSKFALEGFTQMLAEETRRYGIRVNALNPGATRTEMRAAAYPEEDALTLPKPEEITPAFVYLASDESAAVTGKSLDAQ
ncbi:MAG: SDR family NAD(P)-dependent oxidoreductase [Deltaproteobacteria bacterium]|nr:SDR family NAD(P)-dependent oxidoreductase [Deltaproteobacteria bacterium]